MLETIYIANAKYYEILYRYKGVNSEWNNTNIIVFAKNKTKLMKTLKYNLYTLSKLYHELESFYSRYIKEEIIFSCEKIDKKEDEIILKHDTDKNSMQKKYSKNENLAYEYESYIIEFNEDIITYDKSSDLYNYIMYEFFV